jgi:glutamyl-Q tRNA(Asp) synthetase
MNLSRYVGRFAPSPSGALHLGSLACALASYFDAKAHSGLWLVRIEDIDPPRELPGASQAIIECLLAHNLFWDDKLSFQSQRLESYQQTLDRLANQNLTYYCDCSRLQLQKLNGVYDGRCRELNSKTGAIRLNIEAARQQGYHLNSEFQDRICGSQKRDLIKAGDFIIHRRDGLFAYQLAVVTDDIGQGITDIVRGDDLLEVTFNQLLLFEILGANPPRFCHIPVLRNDDGQKLSKQLGAPPLDLSIPEQNIANALQQMGFLPPSGLSVPDLLQWGIGAWASRVSR